MTAFSRGTLLLLSACGLLAAAGTSASPATRQVASNPAPVTQVVDAYISLYRKESLPQWKQLFLPAFTASYTNDDGTVTTRTLEDFYQRQRAAFERGPVSERLENVRIERAGHLAHVAADFYFTSGGAAERQGRLMLLLIEAEREFKIAALAFTYHLR